MLTPRPVVGCTVEARCTKCRKNQPHTVVSLKENHLERVRCSNCDWEHVYKPPTPARSISKEKAASGNEWQQLQSEFDQGKAKAYSTSGKYSPETLINHPTLGLGLVRRVMGQHTVEVLFESGSKLMRCNGGLR